MKKNSTILVLHLLFACHLSAMDLKEAIAAKIVTVEVSGTDYDSIPSAQRNGFAPKMQMTLANLGDRPVELTLPPGYMLEASDPAYQAMLLTQDIRFQLQPRERQRNYIYAMCTELHKSSPTPSLKYRVGGKASPALLQIAVFIAAHKYFQQAAQEAVWSISDDMPIPAISDANSYIQKDLQQQAATIKKVNLIDLQKEYERRKGTQLIDCYGGRLDRNIPFTVGGDSSMVSAGYYDYKGHLIRPIMHNTMLRRGRHDVRYDPFPVVLAGKGYTVRLIKDGSVYREYYFRQ